MRAFKCFTASIFLFSLALLQVGCDVYGDGYNLATNVSECEASGANCEEGTGAALLGINISNNQPYVVYNAAARHFDISGYCNEAGYSQNFIEWSLVHQGSGTIIHRNQKIYQACKRGKFRFQVSLEGGDAPSPAPNEIHRLKVELVGTDLDGNEHRNPLAASRTLDLLAIAP